MCLTQIDVSNMLPLIELRWRETCHTIKGRQHKKQNYFATRFAMDSQGLPVKTKAVLNSFVNLSHFVLVQHTAFVA